MERVEVYGGPLDGKFVDVNGDDPDPWIAPVTGGCRYPGGRSLYVPNEAGRWVWVRDLPPDAT